MNYKPHLSTARLNFQTTTYILASLRRRQELSELIEWARRKRLTGPRRHYTRLFMDEEVRLSNYMLRNRMLYRRARVWYAAEQFLFPQRKHYNGFAAKYRTARSS